MAEIVGPRRLLTKALPTGWDATRILQFQLRSGRTFLEVISDLANSIGTMNENLVRDWGWSFGVTEEDSFEYEDGGSVTPLPRTTDGSEPDPIHGATIGHMIDLFVYGGKIGGSKRAFRDLREAQFFADMQGLVRRTKWRFEQNLLTRWLTNTEFTLATNGRNVPFVRGTGGDVDYAPPAFQGEAFTTSHDHYIGVDDDTLSHADLLNNLAETVQEHGHGPPYIALVSRADIASYLALEKWVEIVDPVDMLDRGGITTGATRFRIGQRELGKVGFFHSNFGLVEVRSTARIATGYAGLLKSEGSNVASNALAVRVHPDEGFGARIIPETTDDAQYPIKAVGLEFEFDVGVGVDRTKGAAGYLVSGGAWANPTIS